MPMRVDGVYYDPNGIKLDSIDFGEDVIPNNNYQHIISYKTMLPHMELV